MNFFGRIFRITLFGESHGPEIGVTIDGCPPGLLIREEDFTADLDRRRPEKPGTTSRREDDIPKILSGVFNRHSSGTPLTLTFVNRDTRSQDYSDSSDLPRPGHADFTAHHKYRGFQDYRGGGHFSGRLTAPLVAAGVVAKKIIAPVEIRAEILEVGGRNDIDASVNEALEVGDSIGGLIECRAVGIPIGWGEPFFDSVESMISHLVFAVPGIRGIEFGSGFSCAQMTGSQCNDPLENDAGRTLTNHSGGVNGGISNGNELIFRVAVKPTSSISKDQKTIRLSTGKPEKIQVKGRHDTCIALRMPVIMEAAAACALADLCLLHRAFHSRD